MLSLKCLKRADAWWKSATGKVEYYSKNLLETAEVAGTLRQRWAISIMEIERRW